MSDNIAITAEELAELRQAKQERDAAISERDHERNARQEESRRADGLLSQVNQDRRSLVGAQVTNFESQAQQAKASAEGISSEISALKGQIADANAEGKFAEAADLQEKMADAAARRNQAQQAHAYYNQQAETAKKQPGDLVDAFFQRNPGYNEAERDWIKRNPRYAADDSFRERVNRAHVEATGNGIAPASPEYYQALEQAGYMRQAAKPAARAETPRSQPGKTEAETGGNDADGNPLSSAAELDEPGDKPVETSPRPGGAAAPSRRSAQPPPRRGQSRRLTPEESDAALAMSEYFPEDVQNGGDAAIFAHYQDIKDNSPMAKRLKEEWAAR